MRHIYYLITLAILLPLLTACAQKWEKPGATEYEFNAMKATCGSRAMAHYPPMMRQVQIGNGYTTPIMTNCSGYGYSVSCYTTGGQYIPPTIITVDDNDVARNQDAINCFYQNGWRPAKDHSDEQPVTTAPPPSPRHSKGKLDKACMKECLSEGSDDCKSFCTTTN